MIDEVTKSIKAQLYDRISSPLFSSFLISWSVWNYKFILVLVSGASTTEKFALIETVFPDTRALALQGGLFPLLTALAIIFLYPYPAKYIYKFSRLQHQELKIIQTQIDDATPMTKEEARKLRNEAMATAAELDAQIDKHRLETSHLKERIVSLQKEIDEVKGPNEKPSATTDESSESPEVNLHVQHPVPAAQKNNFPNLTDEAQELLLEAIEDKSGTTLHAKYIGGTSIQTNGKNQIPSEDRETVALWESALRSLLQYDLVESVGNKGEIFQVTDLGYKTAKLLKLPPPSKTEWEFASDVTARLKNAVRLDVLLDRASPTFKALLQEYLEKHVPPNIAAKLRHQEKITDKLLAAFAELKALD